jgi:NADH dehydrogenase/NADH:ubiquinone oxidoreductase subunit G
MVEITLNGAMVHAEDGWTLLDTIKFYGINILTLCYHEGLESYGGCRLCLVEVGDAKRSKLVTACTHPIWDGLNVRTHSKLAVETRKVVLELLVARMPKSKTLQDMAAQMGISELRFKPRDEDCILCGLCVRMCKEQMGSGAIGFINRGQDREITTPFDMTTDECRRCGGCIHICPACMLRCQGQDASNALCGNCYTLQPTCTDYYDDAQCYMYDTECGTCVRSPRTTEQQEKTEEKSKN